MMSRILCIAAVCLTTFAFCDTVHAQRRVPGYSSRSTISPYVNLFRANNGGLNSYFSYYRPAQRVNQYMRDTDRQQAFNRSLLRQESLQIQQTIEETVLQQRPTSATSAFRRPAGQFMNFGTFYPSGPGIGPRR